jgi:secondary thiamine-phosphate synthase enzyme
MVWKLSPITEVTPQQIATATLRVETPGAGFTEITADARVFIAQVHAGEGTLLVFLRHTSASLTIQENADPDVQTDLVTALDRLAPNTRPGFTTSKVPTTCRRT